MPITLITDPVIKMVLQGFLVVVGAMTVMAVIEWLLTGNFPNPFGPGGALMTLIDSLVTLPCVLITGVINIVISLVYTLIEVIVNIVIDLIPGATGPISLGTPPAITGTC
jgi:hypothetical protein